MRGIAIAFAIAATAATPFETHGKLRVSKSGTYIEHVDGTPFFVLADTCWTGPALSSEADWKRYLEDRKSKGFTAVQFNMVSPWRTAPADADGHTAYTIVDGKFKIDEAFYKRLDSRFKAINDAGLLAIPVLCWAHKKGDAGTDLTEAQIIELISFELKRYQDRDCLWILAGDNGYKGADAEKWKRIGRAVFEAHPQPLVTTHPTGMNFPWNDWAQEKWLTILGYQSGHGDDAKAWKWLTSGPPAAYGNSKSAKPIINLEPPYENHNGYQSRKPHTADSVRRAIYWSLLVHPPCGLTYGGHGVWSWHSKPGEEPTDHKGTGIAKPWREALDLPGAKQLIHLKSVFGRIDWPTLRPAPELVAEQPADAAQFIAAAETLDKKLKLIYIPKGAKFTGRNLGTVSREWIDPATGETLSRGLLPPQHEGDLLFLIGP